MQGINNLFIVTVWYTWRKYGSQNNDIYAGKIVRNNCKQKLRDMLKKRMDISNMEKGQSLIEFGFSLIVIIIVIFGIFNIGRLFWVKIVITNSAREGVRFLILHPDESGSGFISTKNVVIDEASNSGVFIAAEHIEVFCTDSPPSDECDSDTTAVVKVTLPMEFGILDIFGISPVTLSESAKMLTP